MTNERKFGLTVGQLRELLAEFDDDMPVVLAYQYGDHARTITADAVHCVEEYRVTWSEYHGTFRVLCDELDDDEYDDDEQWPSALVLSRGEPR